MKAKEKNKGLKFLRYGRNLRYNKEGIYSYSAKMANLETGIQNHTEDRLLVTDY